MSNNKHKGGTYPLLERFKHADPMFLGGVFAIVILLGLLFLLSPWGQEDTPRDDGMYGDAPAEDSQVFRHPLTGEWMEEELNTPGVYSVMIDNHSDAWPPSGLDQAFLVVEAPVEGGISRMLAFFHERQDVSEIGPVRSARPYYLDWARELDALYVHVGGSPEALDLIASGGTFDMNQFWWGDYFWRSSDRYAPHNVFTSTEFMGSYVQLRDQQGLAPKRLYETWKFKDPEPREVEMSIGFTFVEPVYVVVWNYDALTGRYVRNQYYQPHETSDGSLISADNVAVLFTDVSVIDSVGRRSLRTIGEGEAVVFQDGREIDARWEKPSATQRLRFYDAQSGEQIVMNAGVTWVEVLPTGTQVNVSLQE